MKQKIIFVMLLLISSILCTQERALGHLIVWHHSNVRDGAREAFMGRYSSQNMTEESVLSHELNIVLYTFNHRSIDENEMLDLVRQDSDVHLAQFNPYMTRRTAPQRDEFVPDDTGFNQQWHLKNTGQSSGTAGIDTKATYAWAAALTEENRNEREIVIAVIDGIHTSTLNHSDLRFWKNTTGHCPRVVSGVLHGFNCPNDPICDYHGWNGNTNQPLASNHSNSETHGTIVSGSAASLTNNSTGGAGLGGLFDNIKILPINISMYGNVLNSEAIASFNYILQKRTLYNESNGEYGAYIVAHNNSWGIDAAWPYQYPVWAALYDTLGEQGILATIAIDNTANRNIDTFGDMPGTVTSPWAIKVTRINRNGNRTGAWGPTMVHLAAPGDGIWTTTPNNGYSNTSGGWPNDGTSFAAPIVMGQIGLMYTTASEALLAAFDNTPGDLALIFKELIIDNVDTMSNLNGQVLTGGRLNALVPIMGVLELNEEYSNI